MSNVLRRNRATSEAEFIHNAKRIRTEVTSFAMNEKVIPKKYRYVYAIPMIDICRDLIKNANTYYNCLGEDDESSYLQKKNSYTSLCSIDKLYHDLFAQDIFIELIERMQ